MAERETRLPTPWRFLVDWLAAFRGAPHGHRSALLGGMRKIAFGSADLNEREKYALSAHAPLSYLKKLTLLEEAARVAREEEASTKAGYPTALVDLTKVRDATLQRLSSAVVNAQTNYVKSDPNERGESGNAYANARQRRALYELHASDSKRAWPAEVEHEMKLAAEFRATRPTNNRPGLRRVK